MRKWRYNVFYLSRDHDIEESRDFVGGVLSSQVINLLNLGSIGLMELEIMTLVILVSIPIPIPMPGFQCRGLQMASFLLVSAKFFFSGED